MKSYNCAEARTLLHGLCTYV